MTTNRHGAWSPALSRRLVAADSEGAGSRPARLNRCVGAWEPRGYRQPEAGFIAWAARRTYPTVRLLSRSVPRPDPPFVSAKASDVRRRDMDRRIASGHDRRQLVARRHAASPSTTPTTLTGNNPSQGAASGRQHAARHLRRAHRARPLFARRPAVRVGADHADVRGMKRRVDEIRTARALRKLDELARYHPQAIRTGSAAVDA